MMNLSLGFFRTSLFLSLFLFFSPLTHAYDFQSNGLCYNITSATEVSVTSGISYSGSKTIPSAVTYNGVTYTVTAIGPSAFQGCTGLARVVMPNTLKTIDENAFYECSGLLTLTIPKSVTTINNNAFWSCSGLTSIVVAAGNPTFDSRNNCNALILTASDDLILGCKNTIIPNTVFSIAANAFYNCATLTSITIPNSVYYIGDDAFYNCSGLKQVTLSNNLMAIGNRSFAYCRGVTSFNIPNSVTSIGHDAFFYCNSMTSVTIGNSVASIGNRAFEGCEALKTLYFNAKQCADFDYTSYSYYDYNCFYDCDITEVIIGEHVERIPQNFLIDGGRRLTSVTCKANIPPVMSSSNSFYNYSLTLYVPKGTSNKYRNTNYWNKFTNIVEMEFSDSYGDVDGDGIVNIGDVTVLIDYLLTGNTASVNLTNADVNTDGNINIGDVTALIDKLLSGH